MYQAAYTDRVYSPSVETPFSWTLIADAIALPVSVADAKRYARIDTNDEDSLFDGWIREAVEYIQRTQDTQLMPAQWRLKFDRWPCGSQTNPWASILIPKWPVISVDSIQYIDTNGATQTWASSNYTVDLATKPARIQAGYGIIRPTLQSVPSAVTVNLTLGYASAVLVPPTIKQAIYLMVRNSFERGDEAKTEAATGLGVDRLLGAASWGSGL